MKINFLEFLFIIIIPPKEIIPTDPCYPSPCGRNTICRTQGNIAVCECLPGYEGSPSTSGCRTECTISSDCPKDKACVRNKCVDPCPGVCGYSALCQTINHSPVCSCPTGLVGDPFTLCKTEIVEHADPCSPSPCGLNGQCRVVNNNAVCHYPECVINQDCPRTRICLNQKCKDPCIDACGVNAICQVVNHNPVCSCPKGYIGSPLVECRSSPPQIEIRPECMQDSECTNDKSCINQQCKNPCTEYPNNCGTNAVCHTQFHRPICTCKDSYTGNALAACYEIGCRSDSDCPSTESCINKECINACKLTQCGINAICQADASHKARCYCLEGYKGNPFTRCDRPECLRDEECPYNLACVNERCESPCHCAPGALCTVTNHRPSCQCPPGYQGDPNDACTLAVIQEQPQCKMDADCPSKLACFSGNCRNPCIEATPCAQNAVCTVVDTLPLRTMSCQCLPGFVGDADVQCRPVEKGGCANDNECPSNNICLNRNCVNPCIARNPCASTAICEANNHKTVCHCPTGLTGDPFINCYEVLVSSPECTTNAECSNNNACINERCQDPCLISNPCGTDAICKTSQHIPICNCPDGWGGNPQLQCYKPECKVDSDCPYDKTCINENCLNPCLHDKNSQCGRGADCRVQQHKAQCYCPAGTQGNPLLACITGICQYNEDCADHEACDRLNRICRPVCDDDTCADTAICVGRDHQPQCSCPSGTSGNPYISCTQAQVPVEAECRVDGDCPSQFACINKECQNPCSQNICSVDQECRILDTLPLRTVMCQCPPDTIVDANGNCKPISQNSPQCITDTDCGSTERCLSGTCLQVCQLDRCGINAQCNGQNHRAQCTCAVGYVGNPHIECSPIPKIPVIPPVPECYKNDDCNGDQTCFNEKCINPCATNNHCAQGAFCYVENHQPVCRCPMGYLGQPTIECIPPTTATVGCKSNSECPGSEACVNGLCVSPCNCGPNAECRVNNHYPICFCKSGYSGNPQYGCTKLECQSDIECGNELQCFNGQCLNPCSLEDPCATTAECYGHNHRATCKCSSGYDGNPFVKCERIECQANSDCPNDKTCIEQRCINPCSNEANPPCAQNAICYPQNHAANCRCPDYLPNGNPLSYCERTPIHENEPECKFDVDCPSKLACIRNTCVNPCKELSPCASTAHCSVLDSVPVRTMICTCPDGWVPNNDGECRPIVVPVPPGCTVDDDCSTNETCINRACRNPCNCGTNTNCFIQNHRPICSCLEGFEGNPNIACHAIGCRSNSECDSGKACINGNCINPCLLSDPCGPNAECFVQSNQAQCRCTSGYRGNPTEKCSIVGCRSNSDCPSDRQCINSHCINPCVYDNPCSSRAECRVQNHMSLCRCPIGYYGNPYVDCKPEQQPECKVDTDCPSLLACLNNKCQDPCAVLEPCQRPSQCKVIPTPIRTMICTCPTGYISSGSGTCKPTPTAISIGECSADSDCPNDKSCINNLCKNPCNCGENAQCRIYNHKPVCSCIEGFDGNPEIECVRAGCRNNDDCSGSQTCINRKCVAACSVGQCGVRAECYGVNHRAICDCPPGFMGNPDVACVLVGCRSDSECPFDKACINNKCESPCLLSNPCGPSAECKIYNHKAVCTCQVGYRGDAEICIKEEAGCRNDLECPSQTACINAECINPCNTTQPCGINAECKIIDTVPIRTMICICPPGLQGNAAEECKPVIRGPCPPNTALNEKDICVPCSPERGFKVNEKGYCVCDLERGMIIDENGNCVCPVEHGYVLTPIGTCVPIGPECEKDSDCADNKYCNPETKTCDDPCLIKKCGLNAFCNATRHEAFCQCINGYTGNAEIQCNHTTNFRTDFPRPDMTVSCLSDGVQVEIHITELGFNGVLYVKGHSKDEKCRRVVTMPSKVRVEIFKVEFGNCGLIHVNGQASFVLVIQKHPKLVTYKAQAYHIKCMYQTGEQNVTLGFNVSMLTTAGTIANTGPPPTCLMKIVTFNGQEINSAEIGDNLKLQVDVQPASIYGGFARSCVAKTMEDNVENEYIVTDENGCATDPTIFGEWTYNAETQSLLASFNAFKFPSSDNIRFQCNIRVCFGKCQPVNCRGYNAFGRRRRAVNNENDTALAVDGDGLTGQLREEITIQSNAILTFERREERFVDPTEAPDMQQVEDICVSMIGFIIALIITALLALVAVAVAVSCWLMAYRRRPTATGPLPHPPEFPNPLFTTPEPVAEPSPDYLT